MNEPIHYPVTVRVLTDTKTFRCAAFSPDKGQCVFAMYHDVPNHRYDPSAPWSETLEELHGWYAKREELENRQDPRNDRDDVDEHDDDHQPDDEFSGDRDLAIGERDDFVNGGE